MRGYVLAVLIALCAVVIIIAAVRRCVAYRLISVASFFTAVSGYFLRKAGWQYFLLAALGAGIAANDFTVTPGINDALRVVLGQEKEAPAAAAYAEHLG